MSPLPAGPDVVLRPVVDADLDAWFPMMADPLALHMAAFTPPDADDRASFDTRYRRILTDPTVLARTVVVRDGDTERVAGSIARWFDEGRPEISYWIDPALWGRGIATAALRLFLAELPERPLHARAAADNIGSLRVLEKCGFMRVGLKQGFARARNVVIDEVVLMLDAPSDNRPSQPTS